jgi:hypothetical protein
MLVHHRCNSSVPMKAASAEPLRERARPDRPQPRLHLRNHQPIAFSRRVFEGLSEHHLTRRSPPLSTQQHDPLKLGKPGKPAHPKGADCISTVKHQEMRGPEVVTVELLLIGAGLFGHEHGGANRHHFLIVIKRAHRPRRITFERSGRHWATLGDTAPAPRFVAGCSCHLAPGRNQRLLHVQVRQPALARREPQACHGTFAVICRPARKAGIGTKELDTHHGSRCHHALARLSRGPGIYADIESSAAFSVNAEVHRVRVCRIVGTIPHSLLAKLRQRQCQEDSIDWMTRYPRRHSRDTIHFSNRTRRSDLGRHE